MMAYDRDGIRTYGDLITKRRPNTLRGTCCACHKWDKPTWQLSTRASICGSCCERKSAEVLGSILSAERKARRWIKRHSYNISVEFIAHISGLSVEWVKAEMAKNTGDSHARGEST